MNHKDMQIAQIIKYILNKLVQFTAYLDNAII